MEYILRINKIQGRAAKLNLSLCQLCTLSNVHYGQVFTWQTERVNPTIPVFEREMAKLERRTERMEIALLKHYLKKYPDAARAALAA